MINNKWGYGVILSLACGLSGCYMMDGQNDRPIDYSPQARMDKHHMHTQQQGQTQEVGATHTNKVAASREPVQKSTPGPKRAAAPQIPVIQ